MEHPHFPERPLLTNHRLAWGLLVIRRQLLLVPEAVVLLALLMLHTALGAPAGTAVLGLLVVSWFSARTGLLVLGRRALDQARYQQAARYIWLASRAHPLSADALTLEAALWLARDCPQRAARALQCAAACYPGHAPLHAALSGALLAADQATAAAREAARALVLDPQCATAHLHLANAEQQRGAPFTVVAARLHCGLNTTATAAERALLRCSLAGVLHAACRPAEVRTLLTAIDADLHACTPIQRAEIHYHVGELWWQLEDIERARDHFSQSETLDPRGRYAATAWRLARLI